MMWPCGTRTDCLGKLQQEERGLYPGMACMQVHLALTGAELGRYSRTQKGAGRPQEAVTTDHHQVVSQELSHGGLHQLAGVANRDLEAAVAVVAVAVTRGNHQLQRLMW
eukprot:2354783-Amphidinium_carterae.1